MAQRLATTFSRIFTSQSFRATARSDHVATSRSASSSAASPSSAFENPFSSNSEHTQIAQLPSGDTVSYTASGPPDAPALIYLHGFPCSRLEGAEPFESDSPIRVITPDRPGLGYTTYSATRTLLDYPRQISQLATHLGLDKRGYRVMGGSGGGPYALACAKELPESECKSVGVLAGAGPLESPEDLEGMRTGTKVLLNYSRKYPRLVFWLADRLVARRAQNPNPEVLLNWATSQMAWQWKMVDWGIVKMNAEERALIMKDQGKFVRSIVEIMREHFRQGAHGFMKEIDVVNQPWGFRLEDIQRREGGVKFFYGSEDTNTPAAIGKRMADCVKGSLWKEYPGETHLTLMDKKGKEIMNEMMKD